MRKRILLFVCALMFSGLVSAQVGEQHKVSVKFSTRFDWQGILNEKVDGEERHNQSGFAGKYFSVGVSGTLSEKFSYGFRHRLYTEHTEPNSFLSATDNAFIKYSACDNFGISVGKHAVAFGGYEFDKSPIDIYFMSSYWDDCASYCIGVNLEYEGKMGSLLGQIINSPFSADSFEGLYGYNLIWYGSVCENFSTIYSVNLVEYDKGKYFNYIALGNKFTLDNFSVSLDLINRYADKSEYFFSDFNINTEVKCAIYEKLNVFGQFGYDENKRTIDSHFYSPETNRMSYYGIGAEFFPLKNKDLRLHAFCHSNNAEPSSTTFNLGVTWQINVFQR